MLLCSNIGFINNKHRQLFTDYFENISYEFFCSTFNPQDGWIIKKMGASAVGHEAYSGNFQDKIGRLADDAHLKLNNEYKFTKSGDGKIDLVAFSKFSDARGSLPIVFGQCACASDKGEIERKISEVSFSSVSACLSLQIQHIPFLLSPVDLFDSIQPSNFLVKTLQTVIIDRARILNKVGFRDLSTVLQPIISKVEEIKMVKNNYIN